MFLVLEGIDGGGKTTQARLLAEEIRRRGREVLHVHEPGGTPLGERIRSVLLASDPEVAINARAETLLYSAARAQLVCQALQPALAAGLCVVCERYYYSTLAYQGFGLAEDVQALRALSTWATADLQPDRVVVLDLDPAAGLARVHRSRDRIEARGADYLGRVRAGFLGLAREDAARFRVVDASLSAPEVFRRILEALADVLP